MNEEVRKKLIVAAALFVVLVAASLTSRALWPALSKPTRSGLYAVFLSNGQVYFGSIANETDKVVLLKGIYYIQMASGAKAAMADQSDVSLLKLGNEMHAPQDWMEINRDQVLFIEQLKPDGKVAKAIETYKQK